MYVTPFIYLFYILIKLIAFSVDTALALKPQIYIVLMKMEITIETSTNKKMFIKLFLNKGDYYRISLEIGEF